MPVDPEELLEIASIHGNRNGLPDDWTVDDPWDQAFASKATNLLAVDCPRFGPQCQLCSHNELLTPTSLRMSSRVGPAFDAGAEGTT